MKHTSRHLRTQNLVRALEAVHAMPGLSRSGLTSRLHIARNTSFNLVNDLVDRGLVIEEAAPSSGRPGRPTTVLRPGPESPEVVIVEIGPQVVRAVLVPMGRVIGEVREALVTDRDLQAVLDLTEILVTPLVARCRPQCAGMAAAIYGLVDQAGHVEVAPGLGWVDVPFKSELERRFPSVGKIIVGNDASFSAVHESIYGSAAGAASCLFLFLFSDTGVGGGYTVNGRLVAGRHGCAGEVGHMLINPGGIACACGRTGCWQTEVDLGALRRRWPENDARMNDSQGARAVFRAAAAGDQSAQAAVRETARWAAEGIGSLINVLDPQRVVLAGGLAELLAADPASMLEVIEGRVLSPQGSAQDVVVASQEPRNAAVLGAAELLLVPVFQELVAAA